MYSEAWYALPERHREVLNIKELGRRLFKIVQMHN